MINVCDYEYEIRKLQEELEKEEFESDRQRLVEFSFNREIKEQFTKNIDELHNKFYDYWNIKHPDKQLSFRMTAIIKEFVDFLKQNA